MSTPPPGSRWVTNEQLTLLANTISELKIKDGITAWDVLRVIDAKQRIEPPSVAPPPPPPPSPVPADVNWTKPAEAPSPAVEHEPAPVVEEVAKTDSES